MEAQRGQESERRSCNREDIVACPRNFVAAQPKDFFAPPSDARDPGGNRMEVWADLFLSLKRA